MSLQLLLHLFWKLQLQICNVFLQPGVFPYIIFSSISITLKKNLLSDSTYLFSSVNYDLNNHLFEHNIDLERHNLFILHNEAFIPISTLHADLTYLSRSCCVDSRACLWKDSAQCLAQPKLSIYTTTIISIKEPIHL